MFDSIALIVATLSALVVAAAVVMHEIRRRRRPDKILPKAKKK